jgi:hypothetical protein
MRLLRRRSLVLADWIARPELRSLAFNASARRTPDLSREGLMGRMTAAVLAFTAVVGMAALAAPAHAGTQLLAYDGPDAVKHGQGGEKKVVDGVEFWLEGSPPHRFQVLGVLEDERLKTGLIGLIRMSSLEKDMARLAHQAGGDAVILADEHDNLQGVIGSSFGSAYGNRYGAWGSATSYSSPVESRASKYVVVKYLPDGAAPAWSTAAPQQPPDGAGDYGGRFQGGSTARQ